jgi:superfamily II DNA or RNA helicase
MPHCKITITDEVNCKIADLDLDTRKRLVAKFKFELPYARHMPAFKLGRWDGKVPYFNLGGTTYVNLLPEIIEWLAERNYSFDLDDQRPQYDFQFQQVDEESFSHIVWPKGHVAEGKPIMLRDYQVEIVNTFLENPMGIQEVATGAGKTIMTAALSSRVEPYGRSVVIVPNIDLVKQTEADYRNMGLDVGVFFGDRKEYGKTHTICTWQSLNNIGKKEKDELVRAVSMETFFDGVIAIIVDETHQAKAEVLKSLLTDTLAHTLGADRNHS